MPTEHAHLTYGMPSVERTADGDRRRVGFELEFSGVGLEQAIDTVNTALGGKIGAQTVAETTIAVDDLGEFIVELDWDYLKRTAAEEDQVYSDDEWLKFIGKAAALLVPIEVVCPPIPMHRLGVLDPMVNALRQAGAVGTEESLLAAYGVHINTEIPALDCATLLRYLRAYALLQWWLVDAHDVDPTRRLSPYIDLYPEAYLQQLLADEEADMGRLFELYLEHNATRNRALDLLPLLAEIDAERVANKVDDPKIKPRPAFHYRLPNCHIERDDWSLAASWNTWLVVEHLAQRDDDVARLAREFAAAERPLLGVNRNDWVERIHRWLTDQGLV